MARYLLALFGVLAGPVATAQSLSELLPRLLLIEDRPSDWAVDLYALFRQRGYAVAARSRHNVVWRLP